MVVMRHSPAVGQRWQFEAENGNIQGAGRSLAQSIGNSEHATRTYLSSGRNQTVSLQDAKDVTRHVISCVPRVADTAR